MINTLRTVRDALLKCQEPNLNYANGVLDMYNEMKRKIDDQQRQKETSSSKS